MRLSPTLKSTCDSVPSRRLTRGASGCVAVRAGMSVRTLPLACLHWADRAVPPAAPLATPAALGGGNGGASGGRASRLLRLLPLALRADAQPAVPADSRSSHRGREGGSAHGGRGPL